MFQSLIGTVQRFENELVKEVLANERFNLS